jgi:hypothetical protein
LKQITINLDLDSTCRFDWCVGAIAPFKTGGRNGFEVVGIKSTINLELSRLLGRSKFGANRAPSKIDSTINLKEKLPFITAVIAGCLKLWSSKRLGVSTINWSSELSSLRSRNRHSTINWSLELAWFAIVIAGSFRTKNSTRFCAWVAVVIAEPIWA